MYGWVSCTWTNFELVHAAGAEVWLTSAASALRRLGESDARLREWIEEHVGGGAAVTAVAAASAALAAVLAGRTLGQFGPLIAVAQVWLTSGGASALRRLGESDAQLREWIEARFPDASARPPAAVDMATRWHASARARLRAV